MEHGWQARLWQGLVVASAAWLAAAVTAADPEPFENAIGMRFVTLAPGEFAMGSDDALLTADRFCRRLSALPIEKERGRVYRLPTEAEWEYACRAGSSPALRSPLVGLRVVLEIEPAAAAAD